MVCDTSVAVSMARSTMPGCSVGSVSMFTCRCSLIDVFETHGLRPLRNGEVRPSPLAIRARARFEQRVKDLWPSATGAVLNGGRRPHVRKCGDENFVPRLSPTSPCLIVFSFRALKVWIANDIKIIDTHAATNGGWQLLAVRADLVGLCPTRHAAACSAIAWR